MEKLVNLTPHDINILDGNNNIILVIKPSGLVTRCSILTEQVQSLEVIDGKKIISVPIITTRVDRVNNLPDPEEGTLFIVSALVAQSVKDRDDILTSENTLRDYTGKVIGCQSLTRVSHNQNNLSKEISIEGKDININLTIKLE